MLLDIRERGREAQANRLGIAAARVAPVVPPPPPANDQRPRGFFGFGQPQPFVPEIPPIVQDVENFDWIDNPRTCARCTTTFIFMILILILTNQVSRASPTRSLAK